MLSRRKKKKNKKNECALLESFIYIVEGLFGDKPDLFFTSSVLFFRRGPSLETDLVHKEEVDKRDNSGPKGGKVEVPPDREGIPEHIQDVEDEARDGNTTAPKGQPEQEEVDAIGN